MIATRRPAARMLDAAGFLRFVLRRWSEDRCAQAAGNLTYTTLLAIVPLLAIVAAVLSSAPVFAGVMAEVKAFLLRNLAPDIAGRVVTVYMEDFAANAQRLTLAGLAAVFFVSVALMLLIDRSLNVIWRARRTRPYWLLVPAYAVLLVGGPLLAAVGLTLAGTVARLSPLALPEAWQGELLARLPVAMSAAAFFLLYKLVPHRHVPWRHAGAGAVAAALLFELARVGFAFYVRHFPAYGTVYGAFAALPFFLLWLYLAWVVVLFGAELAACAAYWPGGAWKRAATAGTHFHEAVQLARRFVASGTTPVAVKRLRAVTRLTLHELEDLLARLADAGIVRRVDRRHYVLGADPAKATLEDLYMAAVGPLGGMGPEEWAEISGDFARAASEMREALRRPLASLSRKLERRPRKESRNR